MNFETLCYGVAVVGLLLTGIGRRLIVREAACISTGWVYAIRFLPLADIMFLARFWDSAKTGAFLSMAGLICFLPLGGKTLWDQKNAKAEDFAAEGKRLNTDVKSELYMQIKSEHQARIESRQRKLQQLNAHMAAWYASMNERRAKLTEATPEQLASFNVEAAAYQSLHDVTKAEAAELQTMLNRPLNSTQDVTDEEYGRLVVEQRQRTEKRRAHPEF